MNKKPMPQLSKMSPFTPRLGTDSFMVVGNKVVAVPAKSAKDIRRAGMQAMRSLRTKEAA